MSSETMRAMMAKRPKSKEEIATKWEATKQSTKDDAMTLFEAIKKHIGGGLVDMPISMMKTRGMRTLMVTGWDWQRAGVKKHVPREVLPSIRGILQEMQLASEYRPLVLNDPMVWNLRQKLEDIMNTHRPRSKLTPATAGSLATPKRWMFCDDISVEKPEMDIPEVMNEDVLQEELDTNRRFTAEKRDRDIIMKIHKLVMSLSLARNTPHKKSVMSEEVARTGNTFIKVCIFHLGISACGVVSRCGFIYNRSLTYSFITGYDV
jgi:hypothetical protein